eukprot:c11007_g1_i1.p1 GENE.c11007_g1_i1~~c11007_g1_i1.p1  ORF type:complete len:472 (+),score=99.01 c11007_g1_i1:34-1449(+)
MITTFLFCHVSLTRGLMFLVILLAVALPCRCLSLAKDAKPMQGSDIGFTVLERALNFNGAQSLSIPRVPALIPEYSVSLCVRYGARDSTPRVLFAQSASRTGICLAIATDVASAEFYLVQIGANDHLVGFSGTLSPSLSVGVWYKFTITVTETDVAVWVNGEQRLNARISSHGSCSEGSAVVGGAQDGIGQGFIGQMKSIRIQNFTAVADQSNCEDSFSIVDHRTELSDSSQFAAFVPSQFPDFSIFGCLSITPSTNPSGGPLFTNSNSSRCFQWSINPNANSMSVATSSRVFSSVGGSGSPNLRSPTRAYRSVGLVVTNSRLQFYLDQREFASITTDAPLALCEGEGFIGGVNDIDSRFLSGTLSQLTLVPRALTEIPDVCGTELVSPTPSLTPNIFGAPSHTPVVSSSQPNILVFGCVGVAIAIGLLVCACVIRFLAKRKSSQPRVLGKTKVGLTRKFSQTRIQAAVKQ